MGCSFLLAVAFGHLFQVQFLPLGKAWCDKSNMADLESDKSASRWAGLGSDNSTSKASLKPIKFPLSKPGSDSSASNMKFQHENYRGWT